MADFVMGDGIEIVLNGTVVRGLPPITIGQRHQPSQSVVVALHFDLQTAGASQGLRLTSREPLFSGAPV